jgi:two-component system sensor histidine kinase AlgZ
MERGRVTSAQTRIFLSALVVWLALGAVQAAIIAALGSGAVSLWLVALLQVAHAFAWAAITLGVRWWTSLVAKRHLATVVLAHIGAVVLVSAIDAFVRRSLSEAFVGPVTISFLRTMLYYADVTTLSYILAVWIGKVIDAREAVIAHARHELALRSQLARARLNYLHAQLQPHFLFNALGAVSELIFEDPSAAARMFRQLGSVLRAAVSRNASEIPLRAEVDGLLPYLEVQRTRFSDWLAITLDIDPAAESLNVPPLIFQPLVENSIRHGLRGRSSRGEVSISARIVDDRLVLSVRDNGVGLTSRSGLRRSGVGLSNTAERLRTLYGDEGSLRLFNDELGGAVAEVSIPIRNEVTDNVEMDSTTPAGAIEVRHGFARRHPVVAVVGGCVIAGALWTQQSYAYLAISGRLGDKSILDLLRDDFFSVVIWAALVPGIFWLARRIPVGRRRWPFAVIVHLMIVALLSLTHSALVSVFRTGGTSDLISIFRGSTAITLLLYLAVVAYAQRAMLEEWLAERQLAALRIHSEIAEANIAAASMSVSPETLEATLHEIERHATDNPLLAEQAVARLGNELRNALESGSRPALSDDETDSGSWRPVYGEDGVERLAMGA